MHPWAVRLRRLPRTLRSLRYCRDFVGMGAEERGINVVTSFRWTCKFRLAGQGASVHCLRIDERLFAKCKVVEVQAVTH